MNTLQLQLIDYYLDYVNNYITVGRFAEHKGISDSTAGAMIREGRVLYEFQLQLNKLNRKA